jgi:hypothetical protein
VTAFRTQPTTTTTDTDAYGVHVVCCDPDLAVCGSDRTGLPFLPDDAPVDCPLCALVDADNLPCDAPGCRFREGSH